MSHEQQHQEKLHAIRHQLRDAVHNVLKEHNLPLQLHSMSLVEAAKPAAGFNCCVINGVFTCGPQCP